MKRFLLILMILLLSVFVASAQDNEGNPNDPTVNENANACFEGGSMEGKCHVDFDGNGTVDDYEVAWAWECGWYMIRYDAGLYTNGQLPVRCQSLLPVEPLCFNSPFANYSIEYTGNPNQAGNIRIYFRPNCSGNADVTVVNAALIFADSLAEAREICLQFGSTVFVRELMNIGYDAPPGMYGCDYF